MSTIIQNKPGVQAADPEILIVDDAIEDPTAMRRRALDAEFKDVTMPDGGVYPHTCLIDLTELAGAVCREMGRDLDIVGTGFRLAYANESPQSWVHADLFYGDIACVLYLNKPDDCQGGTQFWTHKPSGSDHLSAHDPLRKDQVNDWTDKEKWNPTQRVDMKFNRLVIYPTSRFHSRWPWEGFGSTPEDGRLIAVGFFKEKVQEAQPEVEVRRATMDDMEFILRSGKEFYLESGSGKLAPYDYKSVAIVTKNMIDSEFSIVLIAMHGGERIGGLSAYGYPLFFNHKKFVYHEQWWWVAPIHRGRGAGALLLSYMEEEARARGAAIMIMSSLAHMDLSKIYKKAGFMRGETLHYKVLEGET